MISGSFCPADRRMEVSEDDPFLSAVKIDGAWFWGFFTSDDLKDNFKPLREGKDDIRLRELINEARSALSDIPYPDLLEPRY